MLKNFQKHGHIKCRQCFNNNQEVYILNNWKIRNDPGFAGSSSPKVLVLGFSKGATQADIYQNGKFDDVIFGGGKTRQNLTNILRAVNLLKLNETVDEKIRSSERIFAFSSLIRCSLARKYKKQSKNNGADVYSTSGSLILKSFKEIPEIISNCTAKFLGRLPKSLKLIVMLGVSDLYIKNCREIMAKLHPDCFNTINEVSYGSRDLVWVHLTHPSKGNGTIKKWLESGSNNRSAYKRHQAIEALKEAGFYA